MHNDMKDGVGLLCERWGSEVSTTSGSLSAC